MDSRNQVAMIKESRIRVIKAFIGELAKQGSPNVKLRLQEVVESARRLEANANASAKTQNEYISLVREELKRIRARTSKAVEVKKNITNPSASEEIDANGDWQEQVYERIQFLKQRYYYVVHSLYQKCCRELQVDPSKELLGHIKHKTKLENILSLFDLSKSQITADMKDQAREADEYIRNTLNLLNKQPNWQQSPDVQPKQLFGPSNSIFSQPNNMVSQDHRVAMPIGSSQGSIINQSSIVKGQSNAVKQQTNIALQEFGVNNKRPNWQQSPDVQLKQLFGPSNSIFSQPNNMVSQDHRVAMPIGSSQGSVINQSSIVKGQSNAVKQQTNIALQEFGVNNKQPNWQQSPDVQPKQLFGPSNSIFSQPNNMVSQDHRVAMPIGSSQGSIINQSSIVKGQSNAVKQQTNIALQEFGVNNKQPNWQQSPDVQPKQLFGPSNSIFSQPNNMVSQDHRVAMPIGSSQGSIINQSSIVKGQSNAVKQQTNIALQEFGVNNNTPRISETEAFGTRTNTERILPLVKESNAVKQQTNIALQEFGVKNNAPRILGTEAFGTRTKTERILPLIKESNDQNQGFHNTEVQSHAMQKLIRALTSISPETLNAAVGEIEEVVHLNDEIREMVDEQGLPAFITPGGWKMPRSFVTTTCDTRSMREGFNQFTYTAESNLNSFTMKGKNSRTMQENQNLFAEIKDINNRLFDCEVVIAEKENVKSAVGIATNQSEGLVVYILYNAVTINQNVVSHFTADKKSLIEPLWLLIPSSYPSCSLVILDELPLIISNDLRDLSERAKEKLRFNLGKMNEPLLIKDIARVWERCAREAILEYAHANGGRTFTSMHGGWEVC